MPTTRQPCGAQEPGQVHPVLTGDSGDERGRAARSCPTSCIGPAAPQVEGDAGPHLGARGAQHSQYDRRRWPDRPASHVGCRDEVRARVRLAPPALKAVLVAVLALCVLSSCSNSEPPERGDVIRYVALGDSTVSGPGSTSRPDRACARTTTTRRCSPTPSRSAISSTAAAPAATIERRHLGDALADDGSVLPAQIDSVTADTDLVTLSVGGQRRQLHSRPLRLQDQPEDHQGLPQARGGHHEHPRQDPAGHRQDARGGQEEGPAGQDRHGGLPAPHARLGHLRRRPDQPDRLAAAADGEAKLEAAMRGAAKEAGVAVRRHAQAVGGSRRLRGQATRHGSAARPPSLATGRPAPHEPRG